MRVFYQRFQMRYPVHRLATDLGDQAPNVGLAGIGFDRHGFSSRKAHLPCPFIYGSRMV